MIYRALADVVVIIHFLFVAFVVLGGFLAWRWRRVAWVHLPAAVWGVAIEFGGWICPLTPLENALRARAGLAGYAGGFVEHHVIACLYPVGLTPSKQVVLGALVLIVNLTAYIPLLRRSRHRDSDRC
jgi:drug/metabolite transporter superfamily protein YnfA